MEFSTQSRGMSVEDRSCLEHSLSEISGSQMEKMALGQMWKAVIGRLEAETGNADPLQIFKMRSNGIRSLF